MKNNYLEQKIKSIYQEVLSAYMKLDLFRSYAKLLLQMAKNKTRFTALTFVDIQIAKHIYVTLVTSRLLFMDNINESFLLVT